MTREQHSLYIMYILVCFFLQKQNRKRNLVKIHVYVHVMYVKKEETAPPVVPLWSFPAVVIIDRRVN